MTVVNVELRELAAYWLSRLEDAARTPDPAILDFIAAEMDGTARVLRRLAAEQRREEQPV